MPTGQEALEISRLNGHARWAAGEGSAAERIAARIVIPQGLQSFTAGAKDTFFAIGSCFARNVEERLEQAGATVTSRNLIIDTLGDGSAREGGIFNKYTPISILQELKWAAGLEQYPEAALLPMGADTFFDPYLSAKAGQGSRASLMQRRLGVAQYFAQAFAADVVILTLGLIETWIDAQTGLYLNEAPHPKILARNPARFRFEVLSLEACEAALNEICAILRKNSQPGQRIVVTVSPVPLGRTFTADDIILANMKAKSTLRVAAGRLVDRSTGIDYYPSYEAAMLSDPALSWQADRLHVSDFVVGHIIRTFLQRYGVAAAEVIDTAAEITALQKHPGYLKHATKAEDTDAVLAWLNHELNKYKNTVIKLQADLRRLEGATK